MEAIVCAWRAFDAARFGPAPSHAFERDPRLEELLRSNLAEALQPILAEQQRLDVGYQWLRQVVMENSQALHDINRAVGSIEARLDEGVALSGDPVQRLAETTAERVAVALEVRGFAREQVRATGAIPEIPQMWMTRDQLIDDVSRAQLDAVRHLQKRQVPEAITALVQVRAHLVQALAETPSDVYLRVQYGYLLKDNGAGVRWSATRSGRPRPSLATGPSSE